jgi:glycosyltransferase involved in cell wall biosynthesis
MKIGVLIPDRNDRPELLANCLRMLKAQTLQPDVIELVNDPSPFKPDEKDITWRYRTGYDRMRKRGFDLIALIENDDYYSPNYLETMVAAWNDAGKPNIIGTDYTIYYHLKHKAYFTMHHTTRSSAMSTLIIPDMDFPWCDDKEPYTDMHLWKHIKGVVIRPGKHICLGIKHGTGFCGGHMHVDRIHRYINGIQDDDQIFLKSVLDSESYKFYSNFNK